MGKKVVAIIAGCTLAAAVFMVMGSTMAQHRVSFFSVYAILVLRLETTLLTVEIDRGNNDFCRVMELAQPGFCNSIDGRMELQDIAQRFCAPVIAEVYPQACEGFTRAYYGGLILVFFMAVNVILQGVACGLVYQYTWHSCRPQYRKWGTAFFCISTFIYAGALMAYGFVVIFQLDDLAPRAHYWASVLFRPNRGTGASPGYLLQWVGIIIQGIVIVLLPQVRSYDETLAEEEHFLQKGCASQEQGLQQPGQAGHLQGYGATGGPMPFPAQPMPPPMFTGAPQPGHPQAGQPAW